MDDNRKVNQLCVSRKHKKGRRTNIPELIGVCSLRQLVATYLILLMKQLLPLLLIVAGLVFGYLGISTFQDSTANASFLGININASDEGGQMTGILYLVLGVVALLAGVAMYRKNK